MEENPDYAMDEFDRTNLFGDEFRPDAPTPSPEPSPPPTPPPYQRDDDDDDGDLPPLLPLMGEKFARKDWGAPGPVTPEYPHESTLLQTVNQLITKYRNDPNHRVKSKKSPLQGYSVEDLKKVQDGIQAKRRITAQQLQEASQGLVPSHSAKPAKEEPPPSPLEKAVMSRRPVVEPLDDEEDCPEQDWETEGSGFSSELINGLYVSLGSIRAGNSSTKLQKQVRSLLDSLVRMGEINKEQKKKIIHDYID